MKSQAQICVAWFRRNVDQVTVLYPVPGRYRVQDSVWDRRVVVRLGPAAHGLQENLTKGAKDLSHEAKERG